jgi:hypothetical protein
MEYYIGFDSTYTELCRLPSVEAVKQDKQLINSSADVKEAGFCQTQTLSAGYIAH